MKRAGFLAGIGAAALTARAAAQSPEQPLTPINPNGTTIARQLTIGVNVPLSGDLQSFGSQVVQGVKAAIDETNYLNQMTGIVFMVRPLDDQNSGAISEGNVFTAAADQTVIGIVGNLTPDVTIATLPTYQNSDFAVVVPTVHADQLTRLGYHNIYRLPTRDTVAGQLFASTIFRKQPSSFALAVTLDTPYGPDVASGFIQQAKSDHRSVDLVTLPLAAFNPAQAARAIVDRNPDYLFLCGTVAQLGPLIPALASAGYNGLYAMSDGFYDPSTITQYGALLGKAVVYGSLPPLNRIPSIFQQFTDLRREVPGITACVAYGYAAAQVLIQTAQRLTTFNRASLLTLLQMSGSLSTILGPYNFDTFGDPLIPNLYFFQISGTDFDYMKPAVQNGFVV